jgi:hypothetical protein
MCSQHRCDARSVFSLMTSALTTGSIATAGAAWPLGLNLLNLLSFQIFQKWFSLWCLNVLQGMSSNLLIVFLTLYPSFSISHSWQSIGHVAFNDSWLWRKLWRLARLGIRNLLKVVCRCSNESPSIGCGNHILVVGIASDATDAIVGSWDMQNLWKAWESRKGRPFP